VSNLTPHLARKSAQGTVLVSSPYFTTSKLCISKAAQYIPPPQTMELFVVIQGSGTINNQPMKAGEVWYLEAGVRETELSGDAVLLQILP
jgi:hypothetical protein